MSHHARACCAVVEQRIAARIEKLIMQNIIEQWHLLIGDRCLILGLNSVKNGKLVVHLICSIPAHFILEKQEYKLV